jgi:hypothetical protein
MKVWGISPDGEKVEITDKPTPIRIKIAVSSKEKLDKIHLLINSHVGNKHDLIQEIEKIFKLMQ